MRRWGLGLAPSGVFFGLFNESVSSKIGGVEWKTSSPNPESYMTNYKLTTDESQRIQSILEAVGEHEGFVNGHDVALLAQVIQKAFGPKLAEKKKTPPAKEMA